MNEPYRLVQRTRPTRFLERVHVWLHRVWDAMREPLPKTAPIYEKIYPGDPRWNDPFAVDIVRHNISMSELLRRTREVNPFTDL